MKDRLPTSKIPRTGIPQKAIVVGDPERASKIANLLDNGQEIGHNREYLSYQGNWKGTDLVVSSHGVGAPGALCMFEDLMRAGVKTIIRIGTCGAFIKGMNDGDLIIATGAVREDGVTDQMVPLAFPALSTPEVIFALQKSAQDTGHPWHRGIVVTQSLFTPYVLETNREYYVKAGVVGIEMELAALLVMAYMKGISAGGIFTSDGNAAQDEKDKEWDPYRLEVDKGIEKSIEIGLNALHYLDGQPDMESKGNNQKIFK